MPCWSLDPSLLPYLGVKIVTVTPPSAPPTPFSSPGGLPLASLDGTLLTLLRTSAASALASSSLAPPPPPSSPPWRRSPRPPPRLRPPRRPSRPHPLPPLEPHPREGQPPRLPAATAAPGRTIPGRGRRRRGGGGGRHRLLRYGVEDPAGEGGEAEARGAPQHGGLLHPRDEGVRRRGGEEGEGVRRLGGRVPRGRGAGGGAREGGDFEGGCGGDAGRFGGWEGCWEERGGGEEVTVFKSVGTAVFDLLTAQLAYESFLKGSENTSEVPTY
ncbi:putative delta(1)-pyrroline-2-carboxylate reductase [Iris pallida]|uniref:Delta(1)-pyrroline-2-carboxylate reductase n=1 Tax=Iris pallida TaxID=29817 RepID=A0AAX6EC40_IRIPA|nr:putative delta(1)-pyrroline-2-carboxylate reductase [Iris pallida]